MRKIGILFLFIFTSAMFTSCYTVDRIKSFNDNYSESTDDEENNNNIEFIDITAGRKNKTEEPVTVEETKPETTKEVTEVKEIKPKPVRQKVELNTGKTEYITDLGFRQIQLEGVSELVDEAEWKETFNMECFALIPTFTPYKEKPKVVSQMFQYFKNGQYTGFITYGKSSYGEKVTIKREGLNIRYQIGKDNQGKPKYMIVVMPDDRVEYYDCSSIFGDDIPAEFYKIVQLY